MTNCSSCGAQNQAGSFCASCGARLGEVDVNTGPAPSGAEPQQSMGQPMSQTMSQPMGQPAAPMGYAPYGGQPMAIESKRTLAGVLGIFLGFLGIHKFVLGYTTEGILAIVIFVFTCGFGGIIGLIEGIIYLTKSDEEFIRTYQLNKRGWF